VDVRQDAALEGMINREGDEDPGAQQVNNSLTDDMAQLRIQEYDINKRQVI
jgi:hypothetical protein